MKKSDVEQIRIEVTCDGKNMLSMLLHRDGTLNRKGDGSVKDDAIMAIGMTDGSIFKSLLDTVHDDLLKEDGMFGVDMPDKPGQLMHYEIIFIGPKPHIAVFDFKLGTDTENPDQLFLFFYGLVVSAIKETDKWYIQAVNPKK